MVQDAQLLQEDDIIYLSKSEGAPRECQWGLPGLLWSPCTYAKGEIECTYTEGEIDYTYTEGELF